MIDGPRRWHLLLDRHNALWASRKEGFEVNAMPRSEFSQYDPMPVREDRITAADLEAVGEVLRGFGIADRRVSYAVCEALLKGGPRDE